MRALTSVWPFAFSEHEALKLMAGEFVLDCPSMRFEPTIEAADHPGFEGAGEIAVQGSGRVRLKCHPREPIPSSVAPHCWSVEAGRVIGDEHLYRLVAKDVQGRIWTASDLLLDQHRGRGGAVFTADATEIATHPTTSSGPSDAVMIALPGLIPFTANVCRKETIEVGTDARGWRSSMDTAQVSAAGVSMELSHEGECTCLVGHGAPGTVDDVTVVAILEALAIVTATPARWCVRAIRSAGCNEIRLRPPQAALPKSRIGPPIELWLPVGDSWRLFEKCVSYAKHRGGRSDPSLGQIFDMIVDSGRGSLEVESIVLGVAVEMLIKYHAEQPMTPDRSKALADEIAALLKAVDGVPNLSEAFRNRVRGAINGFRSTRAQDHLEAMRQKGYFEQSRIDAYKALRNAAAHGSVRPWSEVQRQLDLCASVLVLAHEVLFGVVGYAGPYVDYSTPNYPTRMFGVATIA